jgi:hypothetical protein
LDKGGCLLLVLIVKWLDLQYRSVARSASLPTRIYSDT